MVIKVESTWSSEMFLWQKRHSLLCLLALCYLWSCSNQWSHLWLVRLRGRSQCALALALITWATLFSFLGCAMQWRRLSGGAHWNASSLWRHFSDAGETGQHHVIEMETERRRERAREKTALKHWQRRGRLFVWMRQKVRKEKGRYEQSCRRSRGALNCSCWQMEL